MRCCSGAGEPRGATAGPGASSGKEGSERRGRPEGERHGRVPGGSGETRAGEEVLRSRGQEKDNRFKAETASEQGNSLLGGDMDVFFERRTHNTRIGVSWATF